MPSCNPPLYSSSNFWLHDNEEDDDSSSSTAQEVYIDRAPALPDDPTKPAVSYPSAGGSLQQWLPASQEWV